MLCLVGKAVFFGPPESYVSYRVCQDCKGLTAFSPKPFLSVPLKTRDKATSSPGQKTGLIIACYKSSEYPKLRVPQLQYKLTMYTVSIWTKATDTNMFIMLSVPQIITSFVSDPEVSCLCQQRELVTGYIVIVSRVKSDLRPDSFGKGRDTERNMPF